MNRVILAKKIKTVSFLSNRWQQEHGGNEFLTYHSQQAKYIFLKWSSMFRLLFPIVIQAGRGQTPVNVTK